MLNFHLSLAPCSVTWTSQPSSARPIQLLYLVAARDLGGKWHLVANPLAATSIPILQLEHYLEVRVLAISEEGLEDETSLSLNVDILHNPPPRCEGKRQERNTANQKIPNQEKEVDLEEEIEEKKVDEEGQGGADFQPMDIATLLLPSVFIILSFLAILLLVKQTKADPKAVGSGVGEFGGTLGDNDMPPPIYEEIHNYCVL